MRALLILAAMAFAPLAAFAQLLDAEPDNSVRPAQCAPAPFGVGTKALYAFPPKGAFVAWWCPGGTRPTMYVCARRVCSLVGAQRAVAALLSNPSLSALNAAAKDLPRSQFSDPELIEVWLPHWPEIKALRQ